MMIRNVLLAAAMMIFSLMAEAQSASVSPSRLYYKVAPGGYKSQTIRIVNNSKEKETFTISFADFESPGNKGKTKVTKPGETNVHGCSQWLTASPSFVEVGPGESKNVEILLTLPNMPEANTTRWAVAVVKLTKERTKPQVKGEKVTGMGIIQSFQFIIHIFQTPPAVVHKEATVNKFYRDSTANDSLIHLVMEVENTGETIIDCAPYLDMVNVATGESRKIMNKGFTMLPGGLREIIFKLPKDLPKGQYNVMGVVDYHSDTDLAGAELNLKIE